MLWGGSVAWSPVEKGFDMGREVGGVEVKFGWTHSFPHPMGLAHPVGK